MQSRQTLRRHAALVDRMAQSLNVDLEEAMLRGQLTTSELEDAVLRCTGCSQSFSCEALLNGQATTAPAIPDYCRNTALFAGLTA